MISCAPQSAARRDTIVDTTSVDGREYRVFLSVPSRPPPPDGYGVVYVLDGNRYHALLAQAAGESTVVVAVGYQHEALDEVARQRFRDYTRSAPTSPVSSDVARLNPQYGGLQGFMSFLIEGVQPLVRANARVNEHCEALAGHSLAGLAVLQLAFADPGAFDAYVMASPSIWWADREVLRGEDNFVRRLAEPGPNVTLLVFAGEMEQMAPPDANGAQRARIARNRMVNNATELVERLGGASRRLSVRMQVLAGMSHDATAAPAFEGGLAWAEACTHK